MLKPYYQTKLGKLYHGDCLEIVPKLRTKFYLCVTDPPYGINFSYDKYIDTESNWFSLMHCFIPIINKKVSIFIMPSCKIKRLKWFFNNYPPTWIISWYKGSVGHLCPTGFNDWEPLLFYKNITKSIYVHDYFKTSSTKVGSYGHPCPKPIEWGQWLVSKFSSVNDIVLDPFLGSGTIAVACEQLNRRWVGIEISEKYCEIAAKRIEQESKRSSMRLSNRKAKSSIKRIGSK